MYRFNEQYFGYPQVGGAFRFRQQFVRMPGLMGPSVYRLYDDNAPKEGQFSWQWTEDQINAFLIDWNDPTKLNFGANWFEIRLPLGTTNNEVPWEPETFALYEAHFQGMYDSALIGNYLWRVNVNLELFLLEEQA